MISPHQINRQIRCQTSSRRNRTNRMSRFIFFLFSWAIAVTALIGGAGASLGVPQDVSHVAGISSSASHASGVSHVVGTLASASALTSASVSVQSSSSDLSDQESKEKLIREFSLLFELSSTPDLTCLSVHRNNKLLVGVKEDTALIPASLMKIVTATALFELVDPEDVYTTRVFVRSDALKSVTDGVLEGDIYLVGSGDPVLSTPDYINRYAGYRAYTDVTKLADEVFNTLKSYGVSVIRGRVIGDESWFTDTERDYSTQIYGEDSVPIWKKSFLHESLVSSLSALVINNGYSYYAPTVNRAGRLLNVRADNPTRQAASDFDDLLEERGMVITHKPRTGVAPDADERDILGDIDSPTMAEITARMLSRSDNTIAEMLLKQIGRLTVGSARAQAVEGMENVLESILGALPEEITIVDGSGLTMHNRLTCDFVSELLLRAGPKSPIVTGLAVAGASGTLVRCGPDASLINGSKDTLNKVWGKTGSLNGSKSLAGVTVADNGDEITFTMIANAPLIIRLGSCSRLYRTLINAAARYTYGPPSGSTRKAQHTDKDSDKDSDNKIDEHTFSDVTGSVHSSAISSMYKMGIMTGCNDAETLFCPDKPVTRDYMAAFLSRALELQEITNDELLSSDNESPNNRNLLNNSIRFYDIEGNKHYSAIMAVARAGVTQGCNQDGTLFCPDWTVTRAQMASFFVRAFDIGRHNVADGTNTGDHNVDKTNLATDEADSIDETNATDEDVDDKSVRDGKRSIFQFTDIRSSVHADAIMAVARADITKGCNEAGDLFCPDKAVTRAQMASFLARALNKTL